MIWFNRLKKMRWRKGLGNFKLKLIKLMLTFRGSIPFLNSFICYVLAFMLSEFNGLFIKMKSSFRSKEEEENMRQRIAVVENEINQISIQVMVSV